MSFDEVLDLTADVFLFNSGGSEAWTGPNRCPNGRESRKPEFDSRIGHHVTNVWSGQHM